MNEKFHIHCDGGSRGNPGKAAAAFVAEKKGKMIFSDAVFLGETTNNVAEYQAVILALKWLAENKKLIDKEVFFYLDSQLVVRQINGLYKVKDEELRNLFYTTQKIIGTFPGKIFFEHVAREENKLSDFLVNKKLDELL